MTILRQFVLSITALSIFSYSGLALSEEEKGHLWENVERAKSATVGVLAHHESSSSRIPNAPGAIRGSGFHFQDGYVVTARHVVERQDGGKTVIPKKINVRTEALTEFQAELTGINAFLDVAVYRIKVDGTPVSLGNTSFSDQAPKAGDELFTVGYPLGWGPAIAFGRLGNPNTFLPTAQSRLLQVDLSACSGNSGGGAFNTEGQIVGMVHAIIQTETVQEERRCSRFAFVVPGSLVKKSVVALINGTKMDFSKLGIQMTAVKRHDQWQVSVAKVRGAARRGGIKKGDLLLSIEDVPITSAAQLKNFLIEKTQPGQQVTIRVLRGEIEHDFSVILGKISARSVRLSK